MSVTDDIKTRLDIVAYINQYAPLKKSGGYYKACCPFHEEKTPSFVVREDQQTWRCFGACADGGDIFSFAMRYHNWDFKQALQELGQLAGVEVTQRSPEQQVQDTYREKLRGIVSEAADIYHRKLMAANDEASRAALVYAREKRGLSDETLRVFGMGYAPDGWSKMTDYLRDLGYSDEDIVAAGIASVSEKSGKVYDRFRNRLVVPIRDHRGRAVGFGGRVLPGDDGPKYLNSPQSQVFDKSRLLFALDLAADAMRDTGVAVIVEGYMDVITAHQAGFHNVVAQMGTAMTETQLGLIAPKLAQTIVLALDADAAGQNATMRSLEVARESMRHDPANLGVEMRVLQIPGAKDPDELIQDAPDEWNRLVRHALPVVDYVIEAETAKLPENPSLAEREAVARRVAPLLMGTANTIQRADNLQRLAMRLLLSENDLMLIGEQAMQEEARRERYRQTRESNPPPSAARPAQSALMPPTADDERVWDAERDDDDPDPLGMGVAADVPRPAPELSIQQQRREDYVLSGLIVHDHIYAQVNRVLRGIANSSEDMHPVMLQPFGAEDFERSDRQALMRLFLQAFNQDEMSEWDYITHGADGPLSQTLDKVMESAQNLPVQNARKVSQRDLEQVNHELGNNAARRLQIDIMTQALYMREHRLNQISKELRLLQMDAQRSGEHDEAIRIAREIDRLMKSTEKLRQELWQVSRTH